MIGSLVLWKGSDYLGRFNLLDEAWISVVCDDEGKTKEVSLLEFFSNAHMYKELAGDTKTQDFAVLRILLAVLHTVFSRVDARGDKYKYFDLDEKFRPNKAVDESYVDEYRDDLCDTWFELWELGKFPQIINTYLEKWRERFFLFDESYPFLQVVKEDLASKFLSKPSPSEIFGKNINRLISESSNKISLFSPKSGSDEDGNKGKLKAAEIVRWIITLHAYTGLSDKIIFGKDKYKASKGWLFDLGGIYLKGTNLFETILLNCFLPNDERGNLKNIQNPCWENSSRDRVNFYLNDNNIFNISELYTTWSRAVYIDPNIALDQAFSCGIVKLPEVDHIENYLEPMTLWKYNMSGDNKDKFTPKKHVKNQSLWRSFSLVTVSDLRNGGKDSFRTPGIIDWLREIKERSSLENMGISNFIKGICAVSMEDDGNATSWVPVDEIVDFIPIHDFLLTDVSSKGWVNRINDIIAQTKHVIEFTYKNYLTEIKEIRGLKTDHFESGHIEAAYFNIDKYFRNWLISIKEKDDKNFRLSEWKSILKKLVLNAARDIFENGNSRDFLGIEKDNDFKNIAIAFNKFMYFLNIELK